jgi:leucyl-tRNA---protein transferase
MQIFFSECSPRYESYTFPYSVYCLKERQSELPEIYSRGFLPYTGLTSCQADLFYLCRSLRVDLTRFKDTSENRRVDRKASELSIRLEPREKRPEDLTDPELLRFCLEYAEERFATKAMGEERLRYVLSRSILTHLLEFRSGDRRLGVVVAAMEGDMLHYWYGFFETEYLRSHSLGKWMMWRTLRWAADQGLRHVYLGTCYGPTALYKVRDHEGVEFFDGTGWNRDAALLKRLCEMDPEPRDLDLLKLDPDHPAAAVFNRFTGRGSG